MNTEERIQQLEQRVQQLEKQLSAIQSPPAAPVRNTDSPDQKYAPKRPKPELPKAEPKKKRDWEKEIGQVWLPRFFIFILLIGVIWAFTAASEAGLINDTVRLLALYAGSAGFIAAGFHQWKAKRVALGQVLIGGGIALSFIATYIGHVPFSILGFWPAWLLHMGSVALGYWITMKRSSQSIGVISLVGALLVPFMLDSSQGSLFFLVLYEVAVFALFLLISVQKRFIATYILATLGVPFVWLTSVVALFYVPTEIVIGTALILALLIGAVIWKPDALPFALSQSLLTTLTLALTGVMLGHEQLTEQHLLIPVAVFAGLAFWQKDRLRTFFLSLAMVVVTIWLLVRYDANLELFLLLQSAVLLYLGTRFRSYLQQGLGLLLYGSVLLSVWSFGQLDSLVSWESVTWVALLAVTVLLYVVYRGKGAVFGRVWRVGFGVLGLSYVSQVAFIYLAENGPYLSFVWIGYAAAFIVYGFVRDDKTVRLFGIGLVFVTLSKIVLVDLPALSYFVRAVLFLLIGSIGIVLSRLFYRSDGEGRKAG